MSKYKFEYIWLDGYQPEPNLRSKTKIEEFSAFDGRVENLPVWAFDGSSTRQAEGHSSDCLLKPVSIYSDPKRKDAYLVVAEVLNPDSSPHESNKRAFLDDDFDFWFGFEQEYVLMMGDRPWGFPKDGFPLPQGMYYCGVGSDRVTGRDLVELIWMPAWMPGSILPVSMLKLC